MKRLVSVAVLAWVFVPMALMPLPTTAQGDGDSICEQARDTGRYGRYEVHLGTSGGDVLRGGSGDDLLCGFGGDDVLRGGTGNDILVGGIGNDDLIGASGNDTLYADASDTRLSGGSGRNQVIMGGPFITLEASMTQAAYSEEEGRYTCVLIVSATVSDGEPETLYVLDFDYTVDGALREEHTPFFVLDDGEGWAQFQQGFAFIGDYADNIVLSDIDGNVIATAPGVTCQE